MSRLVQILGQNYKPSDYGDGDEKAERVVRKESCLIVNPLITTFHVETMLFYAKDPNFAEC